MSRFRNAFSSRNNVTEQRDDEFQPNHLGKHVVRHNIKVHVSKVTHIIKLLIAVLSHISKQSIYSVVIKSVAMVQLWQPLSPAQCQGSPQRQIMGIIERGRLLLLLLEEPPIILTTARRIVNKSSRSCRITRTLPYPGGHDRRPERGN